MMVSEGQALASVSRRIIEARRVFKLAVRWDMVVKNPFEQVKAGSQVNRERMTYVDPQVVLNAMDHCPDIEWKLLLALARFCGVRCPSEPFGLKWSDILFDQGRILITSPKTSHHANGQTRVVPMPGVIERELVDAHTRAEPGELWVFPRLRKLSGNIREPMEKILKRAGIAPWPRLFNAMRSSCAIDMARVLPLHVSSAMLGHSPEIAQRHYLKVDDADFETAKRLTFGLPSRSLFQGAPKCAQEQGRKGVLAVEESEARVLDLPDSSIYCNSMLDIALQSMGAEGLEPSKA